MRVSLDEKVREQSRSESYQMLSTVHAHNVRAIQDVSGLVKGTGLRLLIPLHCNQHFIQQDLLGHAAESTVLLFTRPLPGDCLQHFKLCLWV